MRGPSTVTGALRQRNDGPSPLSFLRILEFRVLKGVDKGKAMASFGAAKGSSSKALLSSIMSTIVFGSGPIAQLDLH